MTHALMLFEVPGLTLGVPKTENMNKADCNASADKNDTKKYKKQTNSNNSSDPLSKSKPKSIKTGNEAAEWGKKLDETSSKTALSSTVTKKIEKQSGKSKLQQKMEEKLRGARFRYLNQKLYQSHSLEALNHFKEHPEDFQKYHEGFRSQVVHWPVNPVDIFIEQLEKDLSLKKQHMSIVDMGCGEAKIMRHFLEKIEYNKLIKVHSFDLAVSHPGVVVCDMSKVPLNDSSVDVVIFCLSLMNTNFLDAIREAKRILKPKTGLLRIAEVESRFENGPNAFISAVEEIGFKKRNLNTQYKVFTLFEFIISETQTKKSGTPKLKGSDNIVLKPCLYKKR